MRVMMGHGKETQASQASQGPGNQDTPRWGIWLVECGVTDRGGGIGAAPLIFHRAP